MGLRKITNELCKLHHFWGSHAYLARSLKAMKKMAFLANDRNMIPSDQVWLTGLRDGTLGMYFTHPRQYAEQNLKVLGSDILNGGADRFDKNRKSGLQNPIIVNLPANP